ncbi:MAG: AI-2E family transporter [Patescibacteria group bacterium]
MNLIISVRTLISAAVIIVSGWLLIQVKEVVLALFVALILTLALDPIVDHLSRRRMPRVLAVGTVFLTFILAVIFIGTLSFTPLVQQTERLIQTLPQLIDNLSGQSYGQRVFESLFSQATSTTGNVVRITLDVFNNILLIFTVLVFTFYLLLDFDNLTNRFVKLLPLRAQAKTHTTIVEIENRLGSWLRGQLTLMLIVGTADFVGLSLLRIEYALPLALIGGLLEIVPMFGPLLSMMLALTVGFATSFVSGLGVLALYIFVQQIENNIIVPKVMQKAVGFDPLAIILVLLIGGKLLGIVGALLAVPLTLMVFIIIRNTLDYREPSG